MSSIAQRLIEAWQSQGLKIAPGAREEEISRFERQNEVRLPVTVREYFLKTNGMGGRGSQFDDEFFDFWSVNDVTRVSAEFPKSQRHDYYLFADHSIGIVYYAIKLGNSYQTDGNVIGIAPPYDGDSECDIEFPSFVAFVEAYLRGPIQNCM